MNPILFKTGLIVLATIHAAPLTADRIFTSVSVFHIPPQRIRAYAPDDVRYRARLLLTYSGNCRSFWLSIGPHIPDIGSAAVIRTPTAHDDDGVNQAGYPPATAERAGAEKLMP